MRYLDQEDALRRLGGNEVVFFSVLRKFAAGDSVAPLREALEAGNMQEARAAAHTIKGLSTNLSMPALNQAALDLETALREGKAVDGLPEKVYDAWHGTVLAVNEALDKSLH